MKSNLGPPKGVLSQLPSQKVTSPTLGLLLSSEGTHNPKTKWIEYNNETSSQPSSKIRLKLSVFDLVYFSVFLIDGFINSNIYSTPVNYLNNNPADHEVI